MKTLPFTHEQFLDSAHRGHARGRRRARRGDGRPAEERRDADGVITPGPDVPVTAGDVPGV
jgi:hypothetical protein